MKLHELFAQTVVNGGISIDRKGDIPSYADGYMVSVPNYETKVSASEFTFETFVTLLLDLATEINDSVYLTHCVIGFWYDNGFWYADISERISDRDIALRLAKHRKQLAIFDLASKTTISC